MSILIPFQNSNPSSPYNKIYSLQEDFEKIWKSDREINQIQIESMNKLESLFNRKASEDMKNELNFISKQNDMRMTGQSFFESQLQTSIRTNFKENEEDKEAEEISEIQEKKLL